MADKGPVDHLLDLLVFGPVGFVSEARELVPRLAEKGREQLDVQVRVARMIGQFAVQKGQQEAVKVAQRLRVTASAPVPPTGGEAERVETVSPSAGDEVIPVRFDDDEGESQMGVDELDVHELAIPAYDDLAASQVLPRLEGLRPSELEAVRRYESTHRQRKTVLGKVAQLQLQPSKATVSKAKRPAARRPRVGP